MNICSFIILIKNDKSNQIKSATWTILLLDAFHPRRRVVRKPVMLFGTLDTIKHQGVIILSARWTLWLSLYPFKNTVEMIEMIAACYCINFVGKAN